ncbi:hypothetical protein ACN4BX_05585 [Corynebacterium macclintockiae]|uniref:hypothetical protein n=1 Tax=Corynebacterium macclintockiae TaxID=2913501 RepID=UPI003EC12632
MTTSPKSTTNEAPDSRHKKPRRRASHTIIRSTEAGDHTACGNFIASQWATPVEVDSDGVPLSAEYYPCPACRDMNRLEKDMKGHWPMFRLPADLALDMADVWEIKK